MKRIVITLFLSVAVFVATILATVMYTTRKSLETADYINNLVLDDFQSNLNFDIRQTENTARSFLSGIPYVYIGSDSTSVFIEERGLPEFRENIHETLLHFMRVNKYYHGSMFLIDGDVCRKCFKDDGDKYRQHCSRAYVPYVHKGEDLLYDLSDVYDFTSTAGYQKMKCDREIIWKTPDSTTSPAGRMMTLFVPISLDSGAFFGFFAVSLDLKTINDELKAHLPYGEEHSSMFIVDENDKIFASYPEWIMEPSCQEEIRRTTNLLERHDKGSEHNIITVDGTECYVYQREQLLLPWRIFTISHTDAIYKDARSEVRALIISSIVGMLLMLVCCTVIFRQIRKNLRQKAAAEEELRMAALVQTSMLKPSAFSVSGRSFTLHAFMRPAKEAGGDLYDYIEKDGKLIFCIGDVSGKGMAAALFMTQVISLFRNAVRYTLEPSEIVCQMNDVLSDNPDMTFCTFFVGALCGESIKFCNAGHTPPVLVTSGPSYLKLRPNLALGLMEGYPYQSETIPFHTGDKLVLYTDGVTEAKDKGHHLYGEKKLLDVLESLPRNAGVESGSRIISGLTESLERFVQNAEQSDDITIVSIVKKPD